MNVGDSRAEALFLAEQRSDDDFRHDAPTPTGRPSSKGRIVVADDDPTIRVYLRGLLENHGYSVLEASDGNEALRHVRKERVDLVITDILMPEREGLETIQILKRQHRSVGIVAISGADNPAYLNMARSFGASATLRKPLQAQALLAAVAKVLQEVRTK